MTMANKEKTTKFITRDYAAYVRKIEGEEFNKPDDAYEFSNGRKFKSTDRGTTGFYRR
jgi:hypothetical protein